MKVLLQCFVEKESGPVFTYGMAKGLIANGIEVFAIINDDADNIEDWKGLLDIGHICFVSKHIDIRNHPLETLRQLYLIKNHFKNIKIDYYIDTFPSIRLRYLKFVIDYEMSMAIDHDVKPHSSVDDASASRVKDILSEFQSIIVLSKSFISIARDKYAGQNKKIFYMRHGAMEYSVVSSKQAYSDKYDINFLYFGRIDGYKGLHVLSKAYSNLVEKHKNILLTVAGGGDFSEYENEYAILPNCAVVNKYLTDDDIAYYFSKPNTVVVLPYLDATQSGVIGIAFNYRTPVIVSDTGGLKEQLFDGEMGLFVEPGNAQDLEDKMEGFILNKKLYEEQKEKMDSGYKRSTWDYVTKEFLAQLKGNK